MIRVWDKLWGASRPAATPANAASKTTVSAYHAAIMLPPSRPELPIFQVHFTPPGCADALVELLDAAKFTIYVQAYGFNSHPIASALVRAHLRGLTVEVVLDRVNEYGKSLAEYVHAAGIPTFIDAKHAIAHNKVMIVDDHIVVTGSYNFTDGAETRNAENLLIVDSRDLAGHYTRNFEHNKAHATPYPRIKTNAA